VWSDLLGGTEEITVEVIPRGSIPTTTIIALHTGLAHALEAVDRTESVIIEIIDKMPLILEKTQIPMRMTMGRTPLDIIMPQAW
jgi:hypothetical protein